MTAQDLRDAAQKIRDRAQPLVDAIRTSASIPAPEAFRMWRDLQALGFTSPPIALAVAAWLDRAADMAEDVAPSVILRPEVYALTDLILRDHT